MNKINIEVCIGTACHLLGAMDIALVLDELAAEYPDEIVITKRTCLENCGKGPSLNINGELYEGMTAEELRRIIKQISRSGRVER